ncbi:MAG: site-specific integrase [Planctomycetota bacterium]|jgi:integrase|nr:site-specific integrase [Planctomycetota bacterium]
MSLIKRTYKSAKGKTESCSKYTVQFRDHTNTVRRIVAFASRSTSAELERAIKRLVNVRQVNGTLESQDVKFLESCPTGIIEKLAEFGIIKGYHAGSAKAMSDHIEGFEKYMAAKDGTKKHTKETVAYIKKAVDYCKWIVPSDIQADEYLDYLKYLRDNGRSLCTLNHSIRAFKAFCRWLKKRKWISENPIAELKLYNQKKDIRHYRRAMIAGELSILLWFVEYKGIKHHGLATDTRALLYHAAAHTGLRWSECRSIRRMDVDLGSETPTIFLRAEFAKNREEAYLPISGELKERFVAYFKNHPMLPEAMVWRGMWKDKGFEMLHKDIDELNKWNREQHSKDLQSKVEDLIKIETHDGVLDFHALRTTFGTMLSQAGVQLVTAQKLMRHHDPKLTANFYTRVVVQDKENAIAKLPSTKTSSEAKEQAKTGTYDIPEKNVEGSGATKITDTPTDTRTPSFCEHLRTLESCGKRRARKA